MFDGDGNFRRILISSGLSLLSCSKRLIGIAHPFGSRAGRGALLDCRQLGMDN
ncbi:MULTISPECIES: hypothetical protein [unclassified Bradyrhizobium]|uniref:hypothetical protein n=1 Tax=unclassified Bradyrhizobium TaxID=2631580 RepID=UPI001FFB3C04|nr:MULTISPECIES: hypothetical protein [unclassified Bradyrhizobium]MCK1713819.1 hypothetical protein [Bradyrhizobium sp. 143]MCK1728019.1 hypothetical protein [Bradyrhizobium sp. 142]